MNAENFLISDRPLNMNRALKEADLVITHGCTTAEQALLAGVPVLRVPLHQEQAVHTQRCIETGAGLGVLPGETGAAREACERLLHEPGFRRAAGDFARRNRKYDPHQGLNKIIEQIRQWV